MRNGTANMEIAYKLSLIASSHSADNQRCHAVTFSRAFALWRFHDHTKTLVHSRRLISCRFHYWNALSCDILGGLIQRLQSVQNTAARLVTGTRQRDNISPVLRQLHWLPARHRIEFEVAVLEYKFLHDHTASYMSDDFQLVTETGRRHLTTNVDSCVVPRTQTRLCGGNFTLIRLRLWKLSTGRTSTARRAPEWVYSTA